MTLPSRNLLLLAMFVAFPCTAWANAGTPLMWATMLHLLVGNALIAYVEGALLRFLFRVPLRKAITVMLPANYLSAWIGGWLLTLVVLDRVHLDLTNARQWFWIMAGMTYVATLIMEWPFAAWSLRGSAGWLRRSLAATLVVQTLSYALLFGWYWSASGTSLYRQAEVVEASQLPLPDEVVFYYINLDDGAVYQRSFQGAEDERIFDLRSANKNDRLMVIPDDDDPVTWTLAARLETALRQQPITVLILTNLSSTLVPTWSDNRNGGEGTWMNFGHAQWFGKTNLSDWRFSTGFWPVAGLLTENTKTGSRTHIAYETPFGKWTARNAIHLPNDHVLFQLGDDQVCLFDPASKRIALLCRGRGPMALLRGSSISSPPESR